MDDRLFTRTLTVAASDDSLPVSIFSGVIGLLCLPGIELRVEEIPGQFILSLLPSCRRFEKRDPGGRS